METIAPNTQVDVYRMRVVMAFSGGMDSTALLLRMLDRGNSVTCISYNYGQRHIIELERARDNIHYLSSMGHSVEHILIDISSAMSSFSSSLIGTSTDVPEGHYEEEQMKQTVVPNRNAIFTSILYGHALSISTVEECDVYLALGVHSGDHAIYPDCRPDYLKAYQSLANLSSKAGREGHGIQLCAPLIHWEKTKIIQEALRLGIPIEKTWSCYNNQKIPCGLCDSCRIRDEALVKIGRSDLCSTKQL